MLNKEISLIVFLVLSHSECKVSEEPHCSTYYFEEKVLKKMVRVEFQMEIMMSEMTKSVNTIKALKEEVHASVTTVDEKLKAVADNLEKMAELETKFNVKQEELNNPEEDKFAALEIQTAEKLNGKFEELRDEITKPTVTTAFKARLDNDKTVSSGQIIVFPTVLFNVGDAYNSRTGKYTVPSSGTYLFTTAFCVKTGYTFLVGLMVDGTKYTVTLFYGDAYNGSLTADTVAVLSAGQKIWVEVLSGGNTGEIIEQHDTYRRNTFSGTLANVKK